MRSVTQSRVRVCRRAGTLREMLAAQIATGSVAIAWLGQAGFAIRTRRRRIVIDPYLSDSLAEKYQGKEFPHFRMMPAPITAAELRQVDLVLCTHRHTDHMDPQTLSVIATSSPDCVFAVPRAELAAAARAGVPETRAILMNSGETVQLFDHLGVAAVPAAHEQRATNEFGEDHFLGYVLTFGGVGIYHSGDCVPFDGLTSALLEHLIDVALLPVNGRDAARRARGVPGNFDFDEAVTLSRQIGAAAMVPHHFGMFDFNTIDEALLRNQAEKTIAPTCFVPDVKSWLEISAV